MTGVGGSSCGACKFLRRRCTNECVFAPYFSYDEAVSHFAAVHKVFGASNVAKLLSHLPVTNRREAAVTISYEALARTYDPVYGCVAHIFALQQQVQSLQEEIESLENQMASLAVDISSYGCSQANNNFNNELQISSQLNEMNIQPYLSQQAPPLVQAGNTSENPAFSSPMNMQFANIFGLEDPRSVPHSDLSLLEKLFEGMDHGNFGSNPWIDNGRNIN
ncbi:hypothetical protein NMG60_11018478 [Bertholletia excelsa]